MRNRCLCCRLVYVRPSVTFVDVDVDVDVDVEEIRAQLSRARS